MQKRLKRKQSEPPLTRSRQRQLREIKSYELPGRSILRPTSLIPEGRITRSRSSQMGLEPPGDILTQPPVREPPRKRVRFAPDVVDPPHSRKSQLDKMTDKLLRRITKDALEKGSISPEEVEGFERFSYPICRKNAVIILEEAGREYREIKSRAPRRRR